MGNRHDIDSVRRAQNFLFALSIHYDLHLYVPISLLILHFHDFGIVMIFICPLICSSTQSFVCQSYDVVPIQPNMIKFALNF